MHERVRRGAWILEKKKVKQKKIKKTKRRTKKFKVKRKEKQSITPAVIEDINEKPIELEEEKIEKEGEDVPSNKIMQVQSELQLNDLIKYFQKQNKPIVYEMIKKYVPITKDQWEKFKQQNSTYFR
ncbi:MAG: hypothetical protein AABX74_01000 [Nanoarchaeota archaeon]